MHYFRIEEFACKCCKENKINPELLKRLDIARGLAGIPFRINSGYRCVKHNSSVGGSKNSSHIRGLAADISCTTDSQRWIIVKALIDAGFTRIGIAKTFIHVDIDNTKGFACWLY